MSNLKICWYVKEDSSSVVPLDPAISWKTRNRDTRLFQSKLCYRSCPKQFDARFEKIYKRCNILDIRHMLKACFWNGFDDSLYIFQSPRRDSTSLNEYIHVLWFRVSKSGGPESNGPESGGLKAFKFGCPVVPITVVLSLGILSPLLSSLVVPELPSPVGMVVPILVVIPIMAMGGLVPVMWCPPWRDPALLWWSPPAEPTPWGESQQASQGPLLCWHCLGGPSRSYIGAVTWMGVRLRGECNRGQLVRTVWVNLTLLISRGSDRSLATDVRG